MTQPPRSVVKRGIVPDSRTDRIIRSVEVHDQPEGFAFIDRLLSERMPACSIVDVLTDTEHWLNWTAAFGPLSGLESRLVSPRQRYITTTFCYGCYLGPTQTAR